MTGAYFKSTARGDPLSTVFRQNGGSWGDAEEAAAFSEMWGVRSEMIHFQKRQINAVVSS